MNFSKWSKLKLSQEISFEIHQKFAAQQSNTISKNITIEYRFIALFLRVKCMYVLVLLAIVFVINCSTPSVIFYIFYNIQILFCLNTRKKGREYKGEGRVNYFFIFTITESTSILESSV